MSDLLAGKTITFLGAGAMAEAIFAGLVSEGKVHANQIIATNFSNQIRLDEIKQTYGILTTPHRKEAVQKADIVILAMKPKQLKEAIAGIRDAFTESQLLVSVLAGVSTSTIEEQLPFDAKVVRTMPNTSAKVGESATAISKGAFATEQDLSSVIDLFSVVGTVSTVIEEKIDSITGIAGSGPAYFYYFAEAMEAAAVEAGLTLEEAKPFIAQTIIGVGKRLQTTNQSPKELYEEVMSPNGATEAGINALRSHNGQEMMKEAIAKAIKRSKELGK
ncbi:pyrroline-5-carboxylate reductase [Alkalihalobacillus hemicellulosilyticus]|uniref:Pyrroline-5-carboxylate reductase n=1 Tax=Halalkalibacter hemicellulosilyticusJCM 9152 TaxID=1236971 RepID=W4QFU6_9BACI|nr:pyrroline-5-carboxylate reductase [Halalkalibacter hemicellulosilyticus]GAE30807.1 pyrroline-5-carboxylate reductase [Halalkalibacter hemicellulosilyticusJCM 9152]